MFSTLIQKLSIISLLAVSLAGCGQNPLPIDPDIPEPPPPPSPCDTSPPESQDIPILADYSPAILDREATVANPTGKINEKLQKQILTGEITELTKGDCLDLNGDNTGEVIHFDLTHSDNRNDEKFILTVANRSIETDVIRPTGKVYAAMLHGDSNEIQLLIEGDGSSADPHVEIVHYQNNRLWYIGTIHNYAKNIALTPNGFSGTRRGNVLQTWYRPADYILATADLLNNMGEDYMPPRIVEIPRGIYPMGTTVKLICDLPLKATRTSDDPNMILKAGMNVVLVATDNIEWVYVSPAGNSDYEGGWLQLRLNSYDTCLISGQEISASNVFHGLSQAD